MAVAVAPTARHAEQVVDAYLVARSPFPNEFECEKTLICHYSAVELGYTADCDLNKSFKQLENSAHLQRQDSWTVIAQPIRADLNSSYSERRWVNR